MSIGWGILLKSPSKILTQPSLLRKAPLRSFSSTQLSKFNFGMSSNRSTRYNNHRTDNSTRSIILYTLGSVGLIALATPYLFDYTPLSYFKRNPTALLYTLIGLNVAVFAAWRTPNAGIQKLLYKYFLLDKQYMVSKLSMMGSAFSHQDPLHLGFNMLALFSISKAAIMVLGVSKFSVLYFSSAMISSFFSLMFPRLIAVPWMASSLGASGAIFGVFAFTSLLFPNMATSLFFIPVPGGASTVLLGLTGWNAAGCVLRWGGFDYAGHLGGTLVGVLYGLWIKQSSLRKPVQRRVW